VIMPDRKETVKQQVNPSTSSSGTVQGVMQALHPRLG